MSAFKYSDFQKLLDTARSKEKGKPIKAKARLFQRDGYILLQKSSTKINIYPDSSFSIESLGDGTSMQSLNVIFQSYLGFADAWGSWDFDSKKWKVDETKCRLSRKKKYFISDPKGNTYNFVEGMKFAYGAQEILDTKNAKFRSQEKIDAQVQRGREIYKKQSDFIYCPENQNRYKIMLELVSEHVSANGFPGKDGPFTKYSLTIEIEDKHWILKAQAPWNMQHYYQLTITKEGKTYKYNSGLDWCSLPAEGVGQYNRLLKVIQSDQDLKTKFTMQLLNPMGTNS